MKMAGAGPGRESEAGRSGAAALLLFTAPRHVSEPPH